MGKDRFQSIPGYEDFAREPRTVINQTASLLSLYRSGGIRRPELAREYIRDYTLPFLDASRQGVQRVFGRDRRIIDSQPVEVNEAADVANVVFAWMHAFAKSPYLPMGFSRRGMLQAPQTQEEFERRIAEMKQELGLLVSGLRDPQQPLEARPSALRMHTFFDVGSKIPLKFPDDGSERREFEEEQRRRGQERERRAFNNLLEGIDIELP